MLAPDVQSSLDKLRQVVLSANRDDEIDFYYIFKCDEAEDFMKDSNEPLLCFGAQSGATGLHIMKRSYLNYQKISSNNIVLLKVEDISYEFAQAIEALCKITGNTAFSGSGYGSHLFFSIHDRIVNLFLDVINRACMKDCKVTAEKLLSLHYPFCKMVFLGNADLIEHMITHNGCPVDSCDSEDGRLTALIQAVKCMNLEVFKILIKHGANVDLTDYHGNLPIAYYNSYNLEISGQLEIIEILLSKSIVLKDMPQEKLLRQFQNAFESGSKNIVRMLIEYRNDILNMRDERGQTPLHYLVRNRHSDITELLEGIQIDVNMRDATDQTPVYRATYYSSSHINTFKFLLKNGADLNARNKRNCDEVPLFALYFMHMKLQKEHHIEYIELFLEYNLDIQYIGSDQTTIFDYLSTKTDKLFYMAERFLAHLVILEEQGIPIIDLIRNKINSNPTFKYYFDLCKTELINIKNNSKVQKITLYMILVHQEEKTLKICRSILSSLSQLESLKNECQSNHAYYVTIKKRISNIMKSTELYRRAKPIICKLLNSGIDENHLVATEIASYLDDNDLQILTEIEIE